jgi:hypothetical protein
VAFVAWLWADDAYRTRQRAKEREDAIAKADVVCKVNIIRPPDSNGGRYIYPGEVPLTEIAESAKMTLESVEAQVAEPGTERVTTFVSNGKRIAVLTNDYMAPTWDDVTAVCGKMASGKLLSTDPKAADFNFDGIADAAPNLTKTLERMIAAGESNENLGKVARELLKPKSK